VLLSNIESFVIYLGAVMVSTGSVAVTNPNGTTERVDSSQDNAAFAPAQLEVFDIIDPSSSGGTATTAASQSGFTASILLEI
jgi:hypothetical protein